MSLQDFRPMQERCSNCLGCKMIPFDKIKSVRFAESCPAVCYYNFHTYSARGKFQLGQTLLDGDCEYSPAVTEAVHSCLTCGACDVGCKICRYNLEPYEHNVELKNDAVLHGKPAPVQEERMKSLKAEQTMLYGNQKSARLDWAEGLGLKDALKEPVDALFFAGCKYSYDKNLSATARNAVSLLTSCGVKLGTLGEAETCCAGRAWQTGAFDEFNARADANIKLLNNVRMIVTPCSDCLYAFKRLYAKRGLEVEVLHVVEYLDRLIKAGEIKFSKKLDLTVTYHDPCHLGRLGEPYVAWDGTEKKVRNQIHTWDPPRPRYNGAHGIYDAPRDVIESIPGVRLVEMERIREYSWCCGAGGGASESYPEFSAWTASERITEANSTGAEALVTACPWCEANFSGAKDENGASIEVMDIIDLVRSAL